MKIFHLSDLHIGKMWKNQPMLDDQRYVFEQILEAVRKERPDAVLISGDVYDRSMPAEDAVALFDTLLTNLHKENVAVMIIAGNHDSDQRLSCGSTIMRAAGIHIAKEYSGEIEQVRLSDEYGTVCFHLLPFVKPALVSYYLDQEIKTYTEALQAVVDRIAINPKERNVALAHQYITGALMSDSDEQTMGGLDNVDASVFSPFDYVALGHLHRPQNVDDNPAIRYCGTPLCYSFSEVEDQKSITVVELGEKGQLTVRELPLTPLHKVYDLRGTFDEVTALSYYENTDYRDAFVRITLTDENDIPNGETALQRIYHHMLDMGYDNERTKRENEPLQPTQLKTPLAYVAELFEHQNGAPMSDEQETYIKKLIEDLFNK